MSKMLDFDRFLQEKNKERLSIKVYGKEYTFPPAMPAMVPVMLGRAADEKDSTLETKITIQALDLLLGKDNVDELCQKGMTVPEFRLLAKKVFGMINGTLDDDDEDGAQEMSDEDSRRPVGGNKAKK